MNSVAGGGGELRGGDISSYFFASDDGCDVRLFCVGDTGTCIDILDRGIDFDDTDEIIVVVFVVAFIVFVFLSVVVVVVVAIVPSYILSVMIM